MDIGGILTRSWQIASQHRALWVFGFIAALTTGFGTSFGQNNEATEGFNQALSGPEAGLLFGAACLAFIVGIAIFVVSTVARIALIKGTLEVEAGATSLSVGQLWADSTPYFWKMIGLMLVLIGLALVLALAIVLSLGTLLIPILCCSFIIVPFVGAWVMMGGVSIVADGAGPVEALGRSWAVIRAQPVPVYLLALVLFLVLFGLAFVVSFAAAIIVLPLVAFLNEAGAIIGGLLVLPIVAAIAAIVEAFTSAAWTLAYTQATGAAALPPPATTPPPPDMPRSDLPPQMAPPSDLPPSDNPVGNLPATQFAPPEDIPSKPEA